VRNEIDVDDLFVDQRLRAHQDRSGAGFGEDLQRGQSERPWRHRLPACRLPHSSFSLISSGVSFQSGGAPSNFNLIGPILPVAGDDDRTG